MSFVLDCIRESLPVWQDCLESEFLTRMGAGTLDEACLKGYIVDDSLYLRDYAKVFAWGMTKAGTWDEVRTAYSLLSFVNEGEGATRVKYLARFGLTDAQIQHLPSRPENRAYTETMLRTARAGEGMAECLMACLPCMLSYAWIFARLVERFPAVLDSFAGDLVRDYASEEYAALCRDWLAQAEALCAELSPVRRAVCREVFLACSHHERAFWEMSAKPRADL